MDEGRLKAKKRKAWLSIALLILLGLGIHMLLPQVSTIEKSLQVIKQMTWWIVILAVSAQVVSYLGSAYMIQAILKNSKRQIRLFTALLITLASYSVGLVAGGWVGGVASTYRWLKNESVTKDEAAIASMLPSLLNDIVLAIVSIIGVLYLLFVHDLSRSQLIWYLVAVTVIIALVGAVLLALRSPTTLKNKARSIGLWWAKFRKKDFDGEALDESIDDLARSWRSLGNGAWIQPTIGAIVNIVFDILTLYFVFLAAGHRLGLGVLLAGYGLPLMLGKIAIVLPGGVGVIEGSMVALFEGLHVPTQISVVSILAYRLLSFWIPSLLGYIAAVILGRRQGQGKS